MIKGKPVFNNNLRSLPRNFPIYTILDSWVFDSFILGDEPFAKVLWRLETYVSVVIIYAEN